MITVSLIINFAHTPGPVQTIVTQLAQKRLFPIVPIAIVLQQMQVK